jgi:hypothetical protein
MKYYLPNSTLSTATRPYVKAAAGPYVGTQSSVSVGTSVTVEERVETVIGGQLGGGVDFILGRRVMLGVALGYNIISDFNEAIGGSVNYSGPEFAIGISLLMGSGQQE